MYRFDLASLRRISLQDCHSRLREWHALSRLAAPRFSYSRVNFTTFESMRSASLGAMTLGLGCSAMKDLHPLLAIALCLTLLSSLSVRLVSHGLSIGSRRMLRAAKLNMCGLSCWFNICSGLAAYISSMLTARIAITFNTGFRSIYLLSLGFWIRVVIVLIWHCITSVDGARLALRGHIRE